ncbi:MAG: hypothetical protein JWL93_2754 [Hyphomicrobiales bacterium]|nr:hypothetical protein [Hyphomicrobiales bacterium]
MKTHEFSIAASGLDPAASDFESRFYDSGCDDTLVSFQNGQIIVDFARKGRSLAEAIASAVEDLRRAGGRVERITSGPLERLETCCNPTVDRIV